ncbi:Holliday junction branch migration protein RuvA [Candidatus Woesearchaeota archaeon]|nr:Holliday junction branch migration protein RuvA [Candidatus Woesearchaeota archaeon]
MIGFLRGIIVQRKPPSLLLEVAGVGYEIEVPMSTFYQLPEVGQTVTLHTHLAIREDAHSLYGFHTEAERSLFRSLIRITGVGARLALAILSGLSVEDFHRAIRNQDTARLVKLPGVGKKTAERLMIELADRLPTVASSPGIGATVVVNALPLQDDPVEDAISALIALGFKPQEAQTLVRRIPVEGQRSEDLIRSALQSVAR